MTKITTGEITLTRVLYLEAAIDPDAVGLTPDEVRSVAWGEPTWAEDGQVRAASCVWVMVAADRTVVVDPSGNLDQIIHDPASTTVHQAAYHRAFDEAGVPVESVDTVLLSHIESIGLSAVRSEGSDGWRPFFPNARLLMSGAASDDFERSRPADDVGDAFAALMAADLVDTFDDGDELLPGVHAEWTGMHNPGHCVFHVGDEVTFVGHLAVSPLHLATGPCHPQHADAEGVWSWLQRTMADGRVLIGPLWPSPGAIRFVDGEFRPGA